jgi:hypothetical protein
MGKIMIDWTISVGNLLQVVAFLVVGIGAFFALRTDIRILRHDMKSIQVVQDAQAETMANISSALATLAVQGERLNQLSKTVDEMRHGQGFVNPMRS